MTHRISIILTPILILAAGCTHTQPKNSPQPLISSNLPEVSANSPIHDRKIRAQFPKELGRLQESKQTTPAKELNKQLKERTECNLTLPKAHTQELTTANLYKLCRPSTLIVGNVYKCGKCTKWHESMASGYAIGPDVIATNYHVIENDRAAAMAVMTAAGEVYPIIEILAGNKEDDAAIARVAIPDGKPALEPAPIAPHTPIGGRVAVISHPTSQFYTFTEGMISRYTAFKSAKDAPESVRMTITADYAKGSSGAPVFDVYGNICGMVSSTNSIYYNTDKKGSDANLQMVIKSCVPAAAILNLITTPMD